MLKWMLAATMIVALPLGASAAGDAAKGEKTFRKCKACHAVGANARNKVGPQLNGIVGRVSGSVEGYNYSAALKEAALTWDEATLDKWLVEPKALVKGTKMIYKLKDEGDRADVIAYLATFAADGTAAAAAPAEAAPAEAAPAAAE